MNISTVVAVYNGAAYLRAALISIMTQTPSPAEVIVVDDGSTDATPDIVAALSRESSQPLLYVRQENQGVAMALNNGIRHANGKFLSFLDADDLWSTHKLSTQLGFLAAHPQVDAVFGYAEQFISPELSEAERRQFDCPTEAQPAWIKGTALIRAEIFARVGLFDATWRVGEFIDWYLRAQGMGVNMVMLNDVVMRRRWHKGNMTAASSPATLRDYARIVQAARKRQQQVGA